MRNLIALVVFVNVLVSNGFCQRQIIVDFNDEIATVKDLLGVNREPTNYVLGYKEAGVTMVRMHDDRVNDYYNYTDFWNYDSASNTFTSRNANFDPTDPNQYHWDRFDQKVNAIIENQMAIYFRVGVSYPLNPNYPRPPLTPPLDPDNQHYTKFAELTKRTVMHWNDGWDSGYSVRLRSPKLLWALHIRKPLYEIPNSAFKRKI